MAIKNDTMSFLLAYVMIPVLSKANVITLPNQLMN